MYNSLIEKLEKNRTNNLFTKNDWLTFYNSIEYDIIL